MKGRRKWVRWRRDKKGRHSEWFVELSQLEMALPVCLDVIVAKLKISKSHQKDSQNNPKRYLKTLDIP
jgi:hypothetical protein